jgi:CubicO group peptidase (beta-lactamase class C family)
MVERATGSARLGDYMSEHIWKLLDMKSTTLRLKERPDLAHRLSGITARAPISELVANPPMDVPVKNPRDEEGGAGVYTTAPDYLKLLTSLLRHDGKLLKSETVPEMYKATMGAPQIPRSHAGETGNCKVHAARPAGGNQVGIMGWVAS